MAQLSISVLGTPHFDLDGNLVGLPRRKATALLVYLAVTAARQRRDALATFFWPDSEPARAFAYLRNTIWEINRTLGEGWLVADRETVGLNPGADISLDLQDFKAHLDKVVPHGHGIDDTGCQECIQELEAATALYRGDFLSGFGLPDSAAFDDWQFFQAEEARQALMNGLIRLIRMQLSSGDFEQAIEYARRWVNLDPINEEAHRELMQIYTLAGQRNAAIRQYQECQRILRQELDIDPEATTTALFERIQSGQLQREQSRALTPEIFSRRLPLEPLDLTISESEVKPINNLPIPATPFVGRHEELNEIATRLDHPNYRLITLLGPGGIGKTRLAIQAASDHQEHFQHGICFVSLAPLRSGQPILPAIVDALDLPITQRETSPTEQLVDFLRERELLLILDNFEHLINEAPLVSEILQQTPKVKILTTSRVRLNLQGEWVTEISGLSFPTILDMGSIAQDNGFIDKYCAVEFFLHSAQRTVTDFNISKNDYPAVARITQLVGGMPLGLELAASWVHVLTLDEIMSEIEAGLDFLESSMQDVPERQRSIRAVLDHSWKLMSERERMIFPKLSVFRGGFSRQAAKEVLGISARDLMELVNKSLLQRSSDGRFDLHPLLRQYAIEILDGLEVCQSVHDAHCAYFAKALQYLGESMTDRRQQQALLILDADIDNAWAAWEWAVEHRQVERIDQAIFGLLNFLYRQFRFDEGLGAIVSAQQALATPENGSDKRVYGHILAFRALFELRLGNMDTAQTFFRQSWEQIEEAVAAGEDTRYERAFLYSMKAVMSIESGSLDIARDLLEQSLELYKEIDHKYGASETLFEMAWLSTQQGEIDTVNHYYQKSLELKRQIGDLYGLANELYYMAVQEAFQLGNIEKAKEFYWESSDLFQDLSDPVSNARSLRIMDDLYIISGWFEVALVTRQKMMKIYQNLSDIVGIGFQHAQLGEAYYHLGNYENAERDGRRALEVLKDKIYPYEQAYARWQLGMTLLGCGKAEEARFLFQECVQVYADFSRKDGMGSAYAGLARAEFAMGANDQAWEDVLIAIGYLSEYRHIFWMFYALATVALLLAHQGLDERAIEVYSLISRYDFVANSKWFEDVFGSHIKAVAADLTPERVQAAQERGQSLDVWETAQQLLDS